MPLRAVVDNDILIKCACYSALTELADGIGGNNEAGILGAAKFVVGDRLDRQPGIRNREAARLEWARFLPGVEELEPTAAELALATAVEEAAARVGAALDPGESQLCAIVLLRDVPRLLTGDKRAIMALETLKSDVDKLLDLAGRIGCFEQVMEAIAERLGHANTRAHVCTEPDIDLTMTICFECSASMLSEFRCVGLASYIGDLRAAAPTLLLVGPVFF